MRSSPRLLAVLAFAGVSLLALACTGLLDWVASSLFLALEFLAEFLRRVFARRPSTRPAARAPSHARARASKPRSVSILPRSRRFGPRKGPATAKRSKAPDEPACVPTPRVRVLLPLSDDHPEIVRFALGECRARNAELLLLFVRPLAVTPMGPNPLPAADEDAQARAIFARVGGEAREAGVPLRTFYRATSDRPAAVIGVARDQSADVLLMEAPRRRRFWNVLAGDLTQALIAHLPHVSLIVHAA